MLESHIIQKCLSEIIAAWQKLPENSRPWGVWIAHHESIDLSNSQANTDVISAWFLRYGRITSENPWDYVRFRLIRFDQPWCSKMLGLEQSIIFGRIHEIGFASFA
jgi:hypothetical protein